MALATTAPRPEGLCPDLVRRINGPTADAAGLPNEAYTSERFLTLERERLFSPTWTCIGHACTVPAPGDTRPVDFLGQPLLMVRDAAARVRVFHNVCSHRGNQLVREPCHFAKRIRCSYHSWTYDLDGTLRGTPHIGGPGRHENDRFDRAAHGLKAIRAAVWMDLVFVNLSGGAPPFERHIAGLADRLHALADPSQNGRMRPAATHGSLQIDFDGNWKLVVENNLESYHLPFVHRDLNARSRSRITTTSTAAICSRGRARTCTARSRVAMPTPSIASRAGPRGYRSTRPSFRTSSSAFTATMCGRWCSIPSRRHGPGSTCRSTTSGRRPTTLPTTRRARRRWKGWRNVFLEDMGVVEGDAAGPRLAGLPRRRVLRRHGRTHPLLPQVGREPARSLAHPFGSPLCASPFHRDRFVAHYRPG